MTSPPEELGDAIAKIIAERIKQLREDLGIGYAELSRRLKAIGCPIPELGLSKIESRDRRISADELPALAYVLGVSPMTLLMPDAAANDAVDGTGLTAEQLWAWLRGDEPFGSAPGDRGGRARLEFLARSQPSWIVGELDDAIRAIQRKRDEGRG
ncbi:helix-turn-helix domain-containing protein [Nocardia terpenica]|uniref:HTH cro/C1-type domain-containing protein n=1 Tax=Nocardia terpenica TaxID=455432 RepID=A0A164K2T1_9NOCA|nr:helix-turn-helix transcriptional regulator [Nocardia terpenica]KZM70970.1 hypothetical protein AWN90_41330 [Nocardia terpenica]NQE89720.1 helix-turn-helix transcriptional regulator [Nocardia terpenica]